MFISSTAVGPLAVDVADIALVPTLVPTLKPCNNDIIDSIRSFFFPFSNFSSHFPDCFSTT